MKKKTIFISSVQNEFSDERIALAEFIRKDELLDSVDLTALC